MHIATSLHAPPPDLQQQIVIDAEHFFLARVNGLAGAHRLGDAHSNAGEYQYRRMLDLVLMKDPSRSLQEILKLFTRYMNETDLRPAIDFAWELDSMWARSLLPQLETILPATVVLVVIGYSFPSFNRKVDQQILSMMQPAKVIIQDPKPDRVAETLEDLTEDLHWGSVKISKRDDVNEFVL